ncbi:SH3 domain-containing protein [Pseudoteredinibacter isoporae]|uniref:SH3b domain-containing protein n=1 Tax=Pseudoteredinibacter isoporae TaxID=570281 RepID=A0A7X0JRR8_9GAMM|nr:SH3 domain-containing protein [Pseudoteredinibacter isoporae]MBB6520972.1 hypothetical protein [Pseudoteredinibacter isoporae]NHO86537.1 hypothetical protein [Pseudoteredinibacter isoporae]NIB25011.1 hypothetical protein [Pseudoteredinibacter isoporae]
MPIAERVHWKHCLFRFLSGSVFYAKLIAWSSALMLGSALGAEYGAVTADVVNVYQGPGVQFPRVGQLQRGQIINRLRVQDGWTEISFSDFLPDANMQQRAWIRSGHITIDPISQRLGRATKSKPVDTQTNSDSIQGERQTPTPHLETTSSHAVHPVRLNLETEQLNCQRSRERITQCDFSLRIGLLGKADITRAKVRCESEFLVEVSGGDPIHYHWQQEQIYRIKQGGGIFNMASSLEAKNEFDIRKVSLLSRHCAVTAFGRSKNN